MSFPEAIGAEEAEGKEPPSRPQTAPSRPHSALARTRPTSALPSGRAAGGGSARPGTMSQQEMRRLSRSSLVSARVVRDAVPSREGAARSPKAAQWLNKNDGDILKPPVGTFEQAAEQRRQPSGPLGTSERFTVQQPNHSHYRNSSGPANGPAYASRQAWERTAPRPGTSVWMQPYEVTWRDAERNANPKLSGEGADRLYPPPPSDFTRAASHRYFGQTGKGGHTFQMGTGKRFRAEGGCGGEGQKSHFVKCETAGVPMMDLRSWPERKREVYRQEYFPNSDGRLQHRKGHGGYGGQGSDALYLLPSACFADALVVEGRPTGSFGTNHHLKAFRYDI